MRETESGGEPADWECWKWCDGRCAGVVCRVQPLLDRKVAIVVAVERVESSVG